MTAAVALTSTQPSLPSGTNQASPECQSAGSLPLAQNTMASRSNFIGDIGGDYAVGGPDGPVCRVWPAARGSATLEHEHHLIAALDQPRAASRVLEARRYLGCGSLAVRFGTFRGSHTI